MPTLAKRLPHEGLDWLAAKKLRLRYYNRGSMFSILYITILDNVMEKKMERGGR